jgi:ATP-binding cassette subfamily B protein
LSNTPSSPTVPSVSVWRFLFKYVRKARYMIIGLLLLLFASILLMRFQTYISAKMIGLLSEGHPDKQMAVSLITYLGIFGLLILMLTLADLWRRTVEAHVVPFLTGKVSQDLFVMVHKHSLHFFEEEMAGTISGKVRNMLNSIEQLFYHVLFGIFSPVTEIVTSLIFIGFADIRLALILGSLNLFFLGLTIWFRKQITSYSLQRSKIYSEANGIFVDSVTNSYLVKSFANYLYEKSNYFKSVNNTIRAQQKEMLKIASVSWKSRVMFDLLTLFSYVLIFYFWYQYNLSLENVVLSVELISICVGSVRSMGFVASSFAQVYGTIADGLTLLSRPCDVVDLPNAVKFTPQDNRIVFDHISYSYKKETPLFDNFFLDIAPRQKIGLIGHSGSGKSTLIKLLLRYYNLQSGQICIGGQDITSAYQESLRKGIAVIPQESTLFNRSIMENIRYGNPHASDQEVIEAAKKAYIHDFIMQLPEQYDSKVGERGVMLSGGERQRIAIARAILKNAPVLILDEATSALDSESENYIQKSLKELMKNKTVIVIAHRLSTLKEMDRLIVLEKGKIIEDGSHASLLKDKGAYYLFYGMQADGFLRYDS